MVAESKKENEEVTENSDQPNTITIHRPSGFHNVIYVK